MKNFYAIRILFMSFLFSSGLLALNYTAVEICATVLYACSLNINNGSISNNSQSCIAPFVGCAKETAFLPPNKSLDCFLADSAYDNFIISIWGSALMYLVLNCMLPSGYKLCARKANKWKDYDAGLHWCKQKTGEFIVNATDANGDGKTSAAEFTFPQVMFQLTAFVLPTTMYFTYNDYYHKCLYSQTLPPSS